MTTSLLTGSRDTLYVMSEQELNAMAERFIHAKEDLRKANLAVMDAKAALARLEREQSKYEKWSPVGSEELAERSDVGNVRIVARIEAELRRDQVKYEGLLKLAKEKQDAAEKAWEALVLASL